MAAELELITVRDWLRYAVSRFSAAGLVYGHGTAMPSTRPPISSCIPCSLPIDQLDPWLDARLARRKKGRVCRRSSRARIATRKPASYLTNEAWIRGHSFYVDERVIVPRSYIGELLCNAIAAAGDEWPLGIDPAAVGTFWSLCTGSGCLAILAALAFPEATDRRQRHLRGRPCRRPRNVGDYGLEERIALSHSDLFAAHAGRRYDLILANPPYVSAQALAAFPPEYAAEPQARPCRRRGRPRSGAPDPCRGGRYLTPDGLAHRRGRHAAAPSWRTNIPACPSSGSTRPRARARCSCCRHQPCTDATVPSGL